MTPDIILLIGTIVVAVLAVIVGLIRTVLERRRGPRWEQGRSRRIDPQRLERAVPGPTPEDSTVRALQRQAPDLGSRSGFAALGVPVAAEPVAVMSEEDLSAELAAAADPARVYAYARESDEPDAEPESMVYEPVVAVMEPEAAAVTEPDTTGVESKPESETELEPGLSDAAMAELGIAATPKRRGSKLAVVPAPVEEAVGMAEPEMAEPETVQPAAVDSAAAEQPTDEPTDEPAVASTEPVLFLPGTYTPGAADNEEPAVKPAGRAAAMTAGYAPTARAIFVPPPPEVIEDELAYRIGVRGAQRPSPSVTEVADGPDALGPVLPTVETETWPVRRNRRRRALVGITTIAAVVALAIGASTLPGLIETGGVLGETGLPQASAPGGVPLDTPSPTPPPATSEPTTSPPPQATPSPSAAPSSAAPSPSPSPSAATGGSVKTASVTPRPPAATAPPAVTPKPKPTPTRKPTPKPIHEPIAFFDCTSVGLVLTCDGTTSRFAETYLWDFGEGAQASTANAAHTYPIGGSYLVTLTVTNASGSNSTGRAFLVEAAP